MTAVLLLVFNRPETTARVFAAIRAAQPPRLYVAADGPRPGRPEDHERCQSVRDIATTVDWPCEVKTLFQPINLGGRAGPVAGIDWFFTHETEGIILEDDCLPDSSFFPYCDELLARYRDEPRVMMVSGDYFHGRGYAPSASYFFGRNADIWGWATWRRAWLRYDRSLSRWPTVRKSGWLRRVGDGHRDFERHWTVRFDSLLAGEDHITWDYQWLFSCWLHDGLVVLPSKNLVVNIGAGPDATRTRDSHGVMWTAPLESLTFPLTHPSTLDRDSAADRWEDVHVHHVDAPIPWHRRMLWRTPQVRRVLRRLTRRLSAPRATAGANGS